MLNIRQMECFRATMNTGSMTRAAAVLGIAQPSASSSIQNLERVLGFSLFDRINGRLVATPEAHAILPDINRALETVELTEQRAKQIKEDRYGDISIVSYPDIAIDFLPGIISEFLATRQGVRVSLQARRSEMMSGLLSTHDFDFAITTRLAKAKNLKVRDFQIPCVLIFSKKNKFKNKKLLHPQDILSEKMAIISATHPTMVQFAERFSQSGLNFPEVSIETQTFESVCAFVRRNAAIGLVDFITAVRYMDELDIVFFAPKVFHSIHLLRPADRPTSRLGEQFEDLLERKLSELCEIDMGINSYNR